MANGTLVILGSGEIAPNMVKVYRHVFDQNPVRRAIALDTPFGFQENVPQLTAKIVDYFHTSLHVDVEPATFANYESATELERARYVERVATSDFVFAGPGSPSYAMRQWGPVKLAEPLAHVLDQGGVVCFSSAAALTLGRFTAPIYELYKVGDAPYWIDGLDLLGTYGLRCVVVPHYDNAEGGNHDTRFCYLGERRLLTLESLLDDDVATFGIDEHTAVIIDLASETLSVQGRGYAYWRVGSNTRTLGKGEVVTLDSLRNAPPSPRERLVAADAPSSTHADLGELAARGGDEGMRAIAQLVDLAATGGADRIDPGPLVEGVLAARAQARELGQYKLADDLRDALVAAGIEVQDTPNGATWSLRAN